MTLVSGLLLCLGLVPLASAYNYGEVLGKSILFYEAQRSGALPPGHRVNWRRDSAMGDGNDKGRDLTGGWYDAGDHVKFGFPMAWTTTTLAWGVVDFRDGYQRAGQLNDVLTSLRTPLDYFMKCLDGTTFYGQVGDGHADHAFWGRPEDMTMWRPAFSISPSNPGSDLAGETAAALAAGSMAFRQTDPGYADRLLAAARQVYDLAYNHRGIYSDTIPAGDFYGSNGFNDELTWGALWLFRATREQQYMDKAREFYWDGTPWAYSWDDKTAGSQLLMFIVTGDQQYANHVQNFVKSYMPGGSVPYTPRGLAWRDKWGCLRYAANAAFIALAADKHNIMPGQGRNWARTQINYMLGDTGRSYVVGFGNNPPVRPHHRAASCPWPPAPCGWNEHNTWNPNPHVLDGALVGGPDQNDWYNDDRSDFVFNEVATDYNAGFQSALAGMVSFGM